MNSFFHVFWNRKDITLAVNNEDSTQKEKGCEEEQQLTAKTLYKNGTHSHQQTEEKKQNESELSEYELFENLSYCMFFYI